MAAGDTVKIGKQAVYVGDERYGPGAEVPASRFKKSDLDMFVGNGSVTVHAAADEPKATTTKAKAPKEAGAHADTQSAPDAAEGEGK